jgi:transmembrane sensor
VTKHFSSFEDVIADENFLAWYCDTNSKHASLWQQWLAQNNHYQPLVDKAILYLDELKITEEPVPVQQVEAAHERLLSSLNTEVRLVEMKPNRVKWWLSAAAAVLMIVVGTIFWKTNDSQLKFNTVYGQVAAYKLPDGSEVMLNANSRLSMKKSWEENEKREVWLQGEAFFHVKKTSAASHFIVHADQVDIIVTGTRFNVVNRDGENNVLLKEGSVTLKTKDGQVIKMLPGDFVKVHNSQPKKEVAPQEKVLAWIEAKLVFENTTMQEAAKTISDHYGVKVLLDRGVEQKTISGILPNNSIDVLLSALEATMDFQIIRKDNEIVIKAVQQ